MKVIMFNESTHLSDELSIALGYFDGIHCAHQLVIQQAVSHAQKNHLKSAVLTFATSPNVFLKKRTQETLLTPLPEKIRVLRQLAVDYLIIVPFDDVMATLKPVDFIQNILMSLNARHIVTGFDFRFGHKGQGDVVLLQSYQQQFSLDIITKRELNGEKIGTTEIRQHLAKGDIRMVNEMLGRAYRLSGKIVSGRQKGREIGFPTANLALDDKYEVPARGVYAVKAFVCGKTYDAMCNIGHNPTFNYNENISIEVHLFDFSGDIYGEQLDIEFIAFIREEQKFSSIDTLIAQLKTDQQISRTVLKNDCNLVSL